MRDGIVRGIVALAGLGFCGAGIKIAWWLAAMILEGIKQQDIWKLIGGAILTYFGGSVVIVVCLVIGIALLVAALDN